MFCPKCRAEFREGFIECEECGLALVAQLPIFPEPAPVNSIWDQGDLVTLFESGDETAITFAKMRLDLAGIKYMIKGENIQSLFGWGSIGGYNHALGAIQIKVLKTDAAAAVAVLQEAEAIAQGKV